MIERIDRTPRRPVTVAPSLSTWRNNGPPVAQFRARCPVVGKPVCYRADCRHWSNGCAHPDANR